jgi:hypothetical protein
MKVMFYILGAGVILVLCMALDNAPAWSILLGALLEVIVFIVALGRFVYQLSHTIDELYDD